MRKKKSFTRGLTLMLTLGMVVMTAMSAWAAEDRTKITSIRLKINSTIETGSGGGDIEVTSTSDRFTVGEVEITNENDDWEVGDTPRAKVWLYAESKYYFSSTSSSVFSLTGDDASYVSAKTEDDKSTMVLTFKLDKLEGELDVDEVEWDGESGTGYWNDADGAKSYEVRLYRGSSSVNSAISVNGTSFNFASYITRTGDYSFRVRAVGSSSSNKGEWTESDTWYVDSDMLSSLGSGSSSVGSGVTTGGSWQQNGVGWWYRKSDGTWPANSWLYINNYWYFFNSNGYMATGWVNSNGKYYYCDQTTGAMYVNRKTPDGYTVDGNGVWLGY